jgi:hypothetical protein
MNADPAPRPLALSECLRLLATVPVGRIVYTRQALPAVEPVRFTLDGGHIFAAVGAASALPATVHQSVVAFQADRFDDNHGSWAVTVVGDVQIVSDPAKMEKLRGTGLTSWIPSGRDQFLHIKLGIVTGQQLLLLCCRRACAGGHTPDQLSSDAF